MNVEEQIVVVPVIIWPLLINVSFSILYILKHYLLKNDLFERVYFVRLKNIPHLKPSFHLLIHSTISGFILYILLLPFFSNSTSYLFYTLSEFLWWLSLNYFLFLVAHDMIKNIFTRYDFIFISLINITSWIFILWHFDKCGAPGTYQ